MMLYTIANLCATCKKHFGECKSDPIFAEAIEGKVQVDDRDRDAVLACDKYEPRG